MTKGSPRDLIRLLAAILQHGWLIAHRLHALQNQDPCWNRSLNHAFGAELRFCEILVGQRRRVRLICLLTVSVAGRVAFRPLWGISQVRRRSVGHRRIRHCHWY